MTIGKPTRIHCVTTMNDAGWKETGWRMASSFVARWPANCCLTIYAESFQPEFAGIKTRELPEWLQVFKAKHSADSARRGRVHGRYEFKFDAVKFAHKVAALTDFALAIDDGLIIWLDADVVSHSTVTTHWLTKLFPVGYMAWLDRIGTYPDCGFIVFRASHPAHRQFMEAYRELYISGELFNLSEWHDGFALQDVAMKFIRAGKIEMPCSLSGAACVCSHVFVASELGECLDHLKGDRKRAGRSKWHEGRGRRNRYWTA